MSNPILVLKIDLTTSSITISVHGRRAANISKEMQSQIGCAVKRESACEPDMHESAVKMGRRGGNVGGKARAARLSPERRSEIARMGAAAAARKRQQQKDTALFSSQAE